MANFPPNNGGIPTESATTPINGSLDNSFQQAASLPQGSESSKTLW